MVALARSSNQINGEVNLNLHFKQGVAFNSLATEILYGGAAGGGKSHLMRVAAIAWCAAVPGLQVYLFRRHSEDLRKNHIEGPKGFAGLLAPWIKEKFVRIVKNEVRFWNGSKIYLCHCQYEKDKANYQGAEIHVLLIDELTHFTESIYRYLRGRVRMTGLEVPDHMKGMFPRILCGSNPGSVGHAWVKETFISHQESFDITQQDPAEGGLRRQFIPSLLEDNPSMKEDDPTYEGRLMGMGADHMIKAMRWGDWDIVAGGMFEDVWDPKTNILPPFRIPQSWYVDRAFDWGSSKPFSVGWYAQSDGSDVEIPGRGWMATVPGDLFRFDEWYGWNGKSNQGTHSLAVDVAVGIREREILMSLSQPVHDGPADSQIFVTENGNCIKTDMENPIRIGSEVYPGVGWIRSDKSPHSRIMGWEMVRKYMRNARPRLPGMPREEPGLFITDKCEHFIRTIPIQARKDNKPDDIDTDGEDHIADEVRYKVRSAAMRITSGRHSGTHS